MPAAAMRFAEGDSLGILGMVEVPEACRKSDRKSVDEIHSRVGSPPGKPTGTAVEDSLEAAGHNSAAGEDHSWAEGRRNSVDRHRVAVLVRGSRTLPTFNESMKDLED